MAFLKNGVLPGLWGEEGDWLLLLLVEGSYSA